MKKRKSADKRRQVMTRREGARATVLLCLAAGFTRPSAARAARISKRTLERITADPAFRIELAAMRREAFDDALAGIRGAAAHAVESLAALLRSKREGTRRIAASEILTFAFRSHETGELESRIAALEKRAAEISNRKGAVN
jgi:hypothetical protein